MEASKDTMLGFVGVGRMGQPMAARLFDAGYQVVVYDTNEAMMSGLIERGAVRADSPRDVGDRAEIVLLSLPMPDVVTAVGLGEAGLVHGSAVRIVVDLSTTGPEAAENLGRGLAEKSIQAIDCPVSGGVAGAAKGTLALMAAGDARAFEEVRPVLEVFGKIFHVGDKPGMGQTMKVLNNLLSVTALTITSEALVVGAKAGLDPDTMVDVINAGSGRSSASQDKIPNFVLSRSFDFGFALGLSVKDIGLCLETSERLGAPMQVGAAVRDFLNSARDKLGNHADLTEIIRPIEERAGGIEVRGKAAGEKQ